jgi:hypothetical protein
MEKSITNVVIFIFEVNGFKNIYSKWLNLKIYSIPYININVIKWKKYYKCCGFLI